MYFESKTSFASEPILDAPSYDEGIDMIESHIKELKSVRKVLTVWQTIIFGSGAAMSVGVFFTADPGVSIVSRLGAAGTLFGIIWAVYTALIIAALNEVWTRRFLLVPIRGIQQLTVRIQAWEFEYARHNAADARIGNR